VAKTEEKTAPKKLKLCVACKSILSRMSYNGPVHVCNHAASVNIVTGQTPAECGAMRAGLCGLEGALFENNEKK
jgi:hypothetical protein